MEDPLPEVIDVRPGEEIDSEAIHRWIEGRLPGSAHPPEIKQFARGKANLTYLLRYRDGDATTEYVLRRPPMGPLPPSSHDMAREFTVLSTLWKAFPKAARAFLFCEDDTVIGSPFFVMERRHGVVVQQTIPPVFGGGNDPIANRKLSEVVVDTLCDFHAVDARVAGLPDLGRPLGFMERQVEGWIRRWDAAQPDDENMADEQLANELAGWLRDNRPPSGDPTLVHNDWRLDNMAVSPEDPGLCVAVYDWDMCTRGDPLADLGTVMAVWYDVGEAPSALNPMPTSSRGFMSRDEAVMRYSDRSGRDVSDFRWYLVFGTYKMAVVLQQIFIRWKRGQTDDERFAALGDGARQLLHLAADRRSAA